MIVVVAVDDDARPACSVQFFILFVRAVAQRRMMIVRIQKLASEKEKREETSSSRYSALET